MVSELKNNYKNIKLSVCTPAYNEEGNIANVLNEWKNILDGYGQRYEIIVTNDGSTDNTKEILEKLKTKIECLKVINYEVNHGYGFALSSSINNSAGEYVITIDSDGQFLLSDFKNLLKMLETNTYDVVTGRRDRKKDTLIRVIADRTLNAIIRLLFGIKLNDTNCALKIIKGDIIRNLTIEAAGYPTPTEICLKLNSLGLRIGEEKITHLKRLKGISKLKIFKTGFNFLLFLFFLKYKIILYKRGIINKI